MLTSKKALTIVLMLSCISMSGCGEKTPSEALNENQLKNAAYRTQSARFNKVTLKNGEHRFSAKTGSSTQRIVRFNKALVDDFNGRLMAVVMLSSTTGYAAPFYELALMDAREGNPVNIAGYILGDHIRITDFRLEKKQIIVKMVSTPPQASPKNSKTGTAQETQKIFGVKNGGFVLLKPLPPPSVKKTKSTDKNASPLPLPKKKKSSHK